MIIQCKCKKYKFKIPKGEIIFSGLNVKCEICNQEWSLKLDTIESKNRKLDILQNINPSKLNIGNKIKYKNTDTKLLKYTLIFLLVFFIIYKISINFQFEVIQKFPNTKNIYESLELGTEIIKSYIGFFKEILSEKFINL
jgi:hypothetical protein